MTNGAQDERFRVCSSMVSVFFFGSLEAYCFEDGRNDSSVLKDPCRFLGSAGVFGAMHAPRGPPHACQRFLDSAGPIVMQAEVLHDAFVLARANEESV